MFTAIDYRREYRFSKLDRCDLLPDPIDQFQHWFGKAAGDGSGGRLRRFSVDLYKAFHALFTGKSVEPNAVALATADVARRPSVRIFLIKNFDASGFTFFTNYQSRKGRDLSANPWAALVFYWPNLERQVCIRGSVAPLSRAESEEYFRSRPRESRIAAWASDQSANLADRATLETRWKQIKQEFRGRDVPLPPFWGGYLLKPDRIEFWQGRPSRLHDRFCYCRIGESNWNLSRLAP